MQRAPSCLYITLSLHCLVFCYIFVLLYPTFPLPPLVHFLPFLAIYIYVVYHLQTALCPPNASQIPFCFFVSF